MLPELCLPVLEELSPQWLSERPEVRRRIAFRIAERLPLCRILGVDLQDEYLEIARQKAEALQLTSVEFIHGRAEDVVLEGDFDCVTSCYLAK
jgi:ubiquinone/menaquinone biosynthesis C-methylase UbiE